MPVSQKKASRANNFDSLRLIFAVLVIFSHSFPLTRGSNQTEPLSLLTHGQITFGNISVWAFFVISGFLITKSWQRSPDVSKYLKRRIGRIYPGFAVAAALTALIVVPLAAEPGTAFPVTLHSFLLNTLRLQTFEYPPVFVHNPGAYALNGSLWSVPYEFWCYLGVMTLGLTTLLRRRWFVVALFFAVIGLHLYMDITGWTPAGAILGQIFGYPPFWATVLPFYLAGTLFHIYGGYDLLRARWLMLAAVTLVISNFVPHGLILTMPVCGSYLLMGLAYLPWLHPLNLGRFGDFSYGTYLYAFPIQQLLVMYAHGHISPWLLFAEAAPITLIVGALSWFLVERHFLDRNSQLKHEGLATQEGHLAVTVLSPKLDKLEPKLPIRSVPTEPHMQRTHASDASQGMHRS
jgi:peptidoglycan/LPS O-acetylase OafA/YrhL